MWKEEQEISRQPAGRTSPLPGPQQAACAGHTGVWPGLCSEPSRVLSPALLLAPSRLQQGTSLLWLPVGRKEEVSPYLLLNHSRAQHSCGTGVW